MIQKFAPPPRPDVGDFLNRRTSRSLSARLVRDLALVQIVVVIAWLLAFMTFSPYVTYEELAAASAQRRVARHLEQLPDGTLAVVPSPQLRAYAMRRPGFGFAVLQGARILPGSSPVLSTILEPLTVLLPRSGAVEFQETGRVRVVHLSPARTRYGEVVVATTGDVFMAEDAPAFFEGYLPQFLLMFGPAILAAAFAIPAIVRRSLRPVHEAAKQAAEIEVSSLDRRLSDDRAPGELRPFISAINALLRRVEEGVGRQRMFTANAAHELRTPVAVLSARVDLMANSTGKWAMKHDVRRLAVLIDQLLSAARLEQRDEAVEEVIDITATTRDLVSDLAPLAIRHGRQIEFQPISERARARGDGQALRSALANLIDNALRAEPEHGTVAVRVRTERDRVYVQVADHGSGVAPDHRNLVFEPFWRKDSREPGAGLGLSIALRIARLHQGSLTVSETPGGGATFQLELPAVERECLPAVTPA